MVIVVVGLSWLKCLDCGETTRLAQSAIVWVVMWCMHSTAWLYIVWLAQFALFCGVCGRGSGLSLLCEGWFGFCTTLGLGLIGSMAPLCGYCRWCWWC